MTTNETPQTPATCKCGHSAGRHGRFYATKYGAVRRENCTVRGCSCQAPKVAK